MIHVRFIFSEFFVNLCQEEIEDEKGIMRLRFLCIVCLVAINIFCLPLDAQNRITYIPPKQDKEKAQTSQSSATRGCRQDLTDVVTIIAPKDHVGQTTLAQPILFYSVARKIENPALLTLAEIQGRSALVESAISLEQPGLKAFKMPSNVNLKISTDYLWTITIFCNPKRPSDNVEVQTILTRIPEKTEVKRKIEQALIPRKKSYYSALSGLWYDALYYLYNLNNDEAELYFQDLLEQINLEVRELSPTS